MQGALQIQIQIQIQIQEQERAERALRNLTGRQDRGRDRDFISKASRTAVAGAGAGVPCGQAVLCNISTILIIKNRGQDG
jgi:hypothetical protein